MPRPAEYENLIRTRALEAVQAQPKGDAQLHREGVRRCLSLIPTN